MASQKSKTTPTLYESIGGDLAVQQMIESLFDSAVDDQDLGVFFRDSSVSALITHQIKFYRMVFGPEEDRPSPDDLVDYMILTHSRLFRDYGLNEEHFDAVAGGVVRGLQMMQVEQAIIDECVSLLAPLRDVFVLAAKIAKEEKGLDSNARAQLPEFSAATIESGNEVVRLPEAPSMEIPKWLPLVMKKKTRQQNLRMWTSTLTTAFGEDGDRLIADTFLDMPYMYHHPYLLALLQLAFSPKEKQETIRHCLDIVKYPRGTENDAVCLRLWNRMVAAFVKTCGHNNMGMGESAILEVENNLRSFNDCFPKTPYTMIGGLTGPHALTGKTSHFRIPEKIEGTCLKEGDTPTRGMLARLKILKKKGGKLFCNKACGDRKKVHTSTGCSVNPKRK